MTSLQASPDTAVAADDSAGNFDTRVTRAQEGMLSAEGALSGKPSPFHVMVSADVTGRLDEDRLRAVLARLTRRHPALRTVFTRDPNTAELGCRVLPLWEPVLVEQDLPAQPAGTDPVDVVHRLLTPAAPGLLRPYERPPVLFVLTRVRPGHAVLTVLAHHAVVDGWSIGLLWQEITAGCACAGDLDQVLPEEAAPGTALLVETEQAVRSGDLAARRARELAGWPTVAELPSDLERPATRTFAGGRGWVGSPRPRGRPPFGSGGVRGRGRA
ncbi:condensation domain-containing protein, partial [Streptomyces sp. NPDC004561]